MSGPRLLALALAPLGLALQLSPTAALMALTSADTPTAGPYVQRQLSFPDSLGGLPRDDGSELRILRDQISRSMMGAARLSDLDVKIYRGPGQAIVVGAGVQEHAVDSEQERAFSEGMAHSNGVAARDLRHVAPGQVGGSLHCGSVRATPGLTVCAGTDAGSVFVMAVMGHPGKPGDLARSARDAVLATSAERGPVTVP